MNQQIKWTALGEAAKRLDADKVQQVVTWTQRILSWWRRLRGVPVRPNDQP